MEFVRKDIINKGWSGDAKYCAYTESGEKYLLRVTPECKSEKRSEMYQMQLLVSALGVPMCLPVEFGKCDGGVYTVQTWIEGEDAEEFIPNIDFEQQYEYGIKAGQILRKIHTIPAPDGCIDWEERFNAKIDRKIRSYNDCPVKFDGAEYIIAYIEANRHLLSGRPQSFQHGDYHIGNMMIDRDGELIIIDFDRYDFGDPWEEFNRIVWCAQKAPHFASGIVDGYFDFNVSEEFWRLLALYISSNTLSSVPWAIPFGETEIRVMLDQAKDVLDWYDNMSEVVPKWYIKQ